MTNRTMSAKRQDRHRWLALGIFSPIVCVVFYLGSLPGFATADQREQICLSGSDWQVRGVHPTAVDAARLSVTEASGTEWISACVPGNIQGDLEAALQLKPLYYGMGDDRVHEVPLREWWYRKDFTVPEEWVGRRVTLVFDGVDADCEVWVNGQRVGKNVGMFRRFWVDVTEPIRFGQHNQLAVRIPALTKVRSQDIPKPSYGEMLKAYHDLAKSPTSAAYASSGYGAEWPAIWTLGIWRDVWVVASGPARIDWVRVQTELAENHKSAKVRANLDVDSLLAGSGSASLTLTGHQQPRSVELPVTFQQGQNKISLELNVERPALWWPNGQGAQPLYEFEVSIAGPDRKTWHCRSGRFGIREVRWEVMGDDPQEPHRAYRLVINGRAVRTIGVNLSPPDLLFGRINQRVGRLLELIRRSGANTLRLWGGGVTFPPEFYDAADANGLMLIAEAPLANCRPDEKDLELIRNAEETMRNIVRQLRNHPSIIEWDGGNEMDWGKSGLGKDPHPLLQGLARVVGEEDGRLFRPTSPVEGGRHGPYTAAEAVPAAAVFDDLPAVSGRRFGEFGTSKPAWIEDWHKYLPEGARWPLAPGFSHPLLRFHTAYFACGSTGWYDEWLGKEFIAEMFGELKTLEQMILGGQYLAASGLRSQIDAMRRRGPDLGGATMWAFNEEWPKAAGYHVVDYDGRASMAYAFLRQAFVPVALSLKSTSRLYNPSEGIRASLWLTSDAPTTQSGLSWQSLARDRRGNVFHQREGTASIRPMEAIELQQLLLNPPSETRLGPIFVETRLLDPKGELVDERIDVFGADRVTDPLGGLLVNLGVPDAVDVGAEADRLLGSIWGKDSLENAANPGNLACVANGAKTAQSAGGSAAGALNDGNYATTWRAGETPEQSGCVVDLGKTVTIGRFTFAFRYPYTFSQMRIEVSDDAKSWTTSFERAKLSDDPGYSPRQPTEIRVKPASCRFVRLQVAPSTTIAEFEAYAPDESQTGPLPRLQSGRHRPSIKRPVLRTKIEAKVVSSRRDGSHERLDIEVANRGPMTALFCAVKPILEDRTDLFVTNDYGFVPTGERRVIRVEAPSPAANRLTLAETGWRVMCWNADDAVIARSPQVLLAIGRRDAMCQEFEPRSANADNSTLKHVPTEGARSLVEGGSPLAFSLHVTEEQVALPTRLILSTADQRTSASQVSVTVNGKAFTKELPAGYGLQQSDRQHLARPWTVALELPPGTLKAGDNQLEIATGAGHWFTLDSLVLCSASPAK